jgi:hypothetical protein
MRVPILMALSLVAAVGCGSSGNGAGSDGGGGAGGAGGSGGGGGGGGGAFQPGSTTRSCSGGVPAGGQLADVSHPTTIVGTGSAASCTSAALDAAVRAGGVVTFDCGADPATIAVTATIAVPTDKSTVIDGGGTITLDGGGAVQILRFDSANFQNNENRLTLQRLTLAHGKTTPTALIPTAPAPCSQGYNDGEGGALYMRDGNLTVIDSMFTDNLGAPLGPDTGGGAIYMLGSKHGALIVGSTFGNNSASNGGAVGCLFSELDVYNSRFVGNSGSGHDANNDDATKCSAMNNGQNEIGSGGNGGALYSDGQSTATNPVNIVLCGDEIENNAAGVNAFGGGIFFTSNNYGGTLSIADSTITGNTGGHWTNVMTGSVTNAGDAVGTNAKSITISNSTVQGVP